MAIDFIEKIWYSKDNILMFSQLLFEYVWSF